MAYKILFVCLGNICRSPTAENIMNHLIGQANLHSEIICDSAGTSRYHIGSVPDVRMTSAVLKRGIPMNGTARQFKATDFQQFNLILAMDRQNYQDILDLDRQGLYKDKVRMMCDYTRQSTLKEVPDPYYGGQEGFERVIDLLLDACGGLLDEVKTQV